VCVVCRMNLKEDIGASHIWSGQFAKKVVAQLKDAKAIQVPERWWEGGETVGGDVEFAQKGQRGDVVWEL
jgi:hypothetical protein